jgi:cathepsin F/cysteine peptidase B
MNPFYLFLTFVFAVSAAPNSTDIAAKFFKFQSDFSKAYASAEEEAARFVAFNQSLHDVAVLNSNEDDWGVYGITIFSDSTAEERAMRRGRTYNAKASSEFDYESFALLPPQKWDQFCQSCEKFPEISLDAPLPSSIDWVSKGAVTGVKDQGNCGDCWSFGAAGDVEGTWFLADHDLVSLSEQQLTSCDHTGDDSGCGGSSSDMDSFKYIVNNGGLASEAAYPFCSGDASCKGKNKKQRTNGVCNKKLEKKTVAHISGAMQISGGVDKYDPQPVSEAAVMKALMLHGPMAIAVNAGGSAWENYEEGIISPKHCSGDPQDLDHIVLLVGFGEEKKGKETLKYWKIKNSWTTDWGEEGYIRIKRGDAKHPNLNMCGVVSDAETSYLKK